MLTAINLKGNWGTLLLPVSEDDSIDYTRLNDEIDYLIDAKVDGIYSNGTAGEFHNQTEDEFDKINGMLAEKCHVANMRFQIGVSHPGAIISFERLKRATALEPDAFQIVLPDWVTTTAPEEIIFLKRMAAYANQIPLVLYNPPHAKKVLSPNELRILSEAIPQLIGIKVAGGDESWYRDMQWSKNKLSVFVPGHFLATGVKRKIASGAYSNVACLSPKGAQWWWALMQDDIDAAIEIEKRILQFFNECVVPFKEAGYSNPALDKLLAAIGGWSNIGTRLRWPYKWISEAEAQNLSARARALLPEFFK